MGEELEEGKHKEMYLLFRDYNLLNRETLYLRNAIFMLEITKTPQGILVAKELDHILSRMHILIQEKSSQIEDKLGFFI